MLLTTPPNQAVLNVTILLIRKKNPLIEKKNPLIGKRKSLIEKRVRIVP